MDHLFLMLLTRRALSAISASHIVPDSMILWPARRFSQHEAKKLRIPPQVELVSSEHRLLAQHPAILKCDPATIVSSSIILPTRFGINSLSLPVKLPAEPSFIHSFKPTMDTINENIASQKRSTTYSTMKSGVASVVKIWNRTSTVFHSTVRAVKKFVTHREGPEEQDALQNNNKGPAFSCACSDPETRVDRSVVEELTTLVAACEGAAVPVHPNRLLKRVTGPSVCWIYSLVDLLYRTAGYETPAYFDCILWKSLLLAIRHCEVIIVPPVVPTQMSEVRIHVSVKPICYSCIYAGSTDARYRPP